MTDAYHQKLDEHSFAHRYDPLRDAVRRVLVAWDHRYDSSDLPEAMEKLRHTLVSVARGDEQPHPGDHRLCSATGHAMPGRCENCGATFEEVDEVEVTYDRSPLPVEAPERPVERRRSGAKNVSDPIYQNAFIEESRAAMGQPSKQDAEALLGHTVTLSFNVDWKPVTGVLTDVVDHPAGAPYLLLDNYRERSYPLNAIQQIVKVR